MDLKKLNSEVIAQFRANGGRMVEGPFAGASLLLLSSVGARSGEPRTNPLAYLQDGDRLVVIASYAGAAINPPWYYNLLANPDVEVEVRNERFRARATVAKEPERTELFSRMAAVMPAFSDYQSKTRRVIPVIVLERGAQPG